MAEQLNLKYCK